MKHLLTTFERHDVSTTSAAIVGSPSARRRNSRLKHLAFMLLFLLGSIGDVWGDVTWTRVTAVSDLTSGGTFIIGYEATANSGIIIPMANTGSATTSAAGFIYSGSSASSGGTGTIDMSSVSETSNFEVTIVSSGDGNIAIKLGANFLGNANTKNNAKLFTTDASPNGTSLTPTIGNNNVVTLKNANASYHTLQYNSGSPRFAFYGGGQKNLVIYKKSQSGPAQPTLSFAPFLPDPIGSIPILSRAILASSYTLYILCIYPVIFLPRPSFKCFIMSMVVSYRFYRADKRALYCRIIIV